MKMHKILNVEIAVHDFKIEDSTIKQNEKCLHMQISIGDKKHVVFTGSRPLMDVIQKIPKDKFPFLTKIVKENEWYEFS